MPYAPPVLCAARVAVDPRRQLVLRHHEPLANLERGKALAVYQGVGPGFGDAQCPGQLRRSAWPEVHQNACNLLSNVRLLSVIEFHILLTRFFLYLVW